ncbi:MAG: limonene-1,2-epoxide hydrolase family protein [Rhodospirillaceae bacterium]|nr:limonene-1,2-epoxide hydrolase family protein [Rhodospirillaceae bacterium]
MKGKLMIGPSRRVAMLAAGLAPVAAPPVFGATANPAEQANIDLVTTFCLAWAEKNVEKLAPFLDDNIEYQVFEGGPVIKGIAQFRAQMGGFMASMAEIRWKVFRSAAMGDLVLNERLDHFIRQPGSGRPDDHFRVTGVFVVRSGRILYWKDWNLSAKPG